MTTRTPVARTERPPQLNGGIRNALGGLALGLFAWVLSPSPTRAEWPPYTAPPALNQSLSAGGAGNSITKQELQNIGFYMRLLRPDKLNNPVVVRVESSPTSIPGDKIPADMRRYISDAVGHITDGVILETPYAFGGTNGSIAEPMMVLDGSILRFDERIERKEAEFRLGLLSKINPKVNLEPTAEWGRSWEASKLGISLTLREPLKAQVGSNLVTFPHLVTRPGRTIDLESTLIRSEKNRQLGLFVVGSGLTWSGRSSRQNGVHDAIIQMCDRGTLVAVSRELGLPYWLVMQDAVPDLWVLKSAATLFQNLSPQWQDHQLNACRSAFKHPKIPRDRSVEQYLEKLGGIDNATREYLSLLIVGPSHENRSGVKLPAPISGILVEFVGYPVKYSHAFQTFLGNMRGRPLVTLSEDPMRFHVQKAVSKEQVEKYLLQNFQASVGVACSVDLARPYYVRVINPNAF